MRRFAIRVLGFELLAFEAEEELLLMDEGVDDESPAHYARDVSETVVDPEVDDYAVETLRSSTAVSTKRTPFGFSAS